MQDASELISLVRARLKVEQQLYSLAGMPKEGKLQLITTLDDIRSKERGWLAAWDAQEKLRGVKP
jgi:hypothetical protein